MDIKLDDDIKLVDINQELEVQKRRIEIEEKRATERKIRIDRFGQLFFPSIIYAALFALCLYNNMSGIMVPSFAVGTYIYSLYTMHMYDIKVKALSYFCGAIMIMLGISSFLTGNEGIQFANINGIFIILIYMMIHSSYNDDNWGFLKSLGAILLTGIEAIGSIADPFIDLSEYSKSDKKKDHSNVMHVFLGIGIAVPVTAIAVSLLMSADIVFKQFTENIFGEINMGTIIGVFIFFTVGFFFSYSGIAGLNKKSVNEDVKDSKAHSAVVAITSLVAICLVYIIFCYIQVAYLFIGGMTLPEGYTYAEYVHEGFYQLLFVCLMNLGIVLIALGFFEKNKLLNALLLVISCCTGVMVASCAFRITMYVSAYGLSFLRVLVYWTLAVVSVFLLGLLMQIFRPTFKLFRYGFVSFCLLYLALAYSKPDYLIADYNLNVLAKENTSSVDYYYLCNLSTDAAPVIADYIYSHPDVDEMDRYANKMCGLEKESWRKYNYSKDTARKLYDGWHGQMDWDNEAY